MKIKGLLLDLDNTLYPYQSVHTLASASVNSFLAQQTGLTETDLAEAYTKGRKWVHHQLAQTASSHNRLLYYQKALEYLGIKPFPLALQAYRRYWGVFCANMQLFPTALTFLKKAKVLGLSTCIVTDLTADVQYQKLAALGITSYIDALVTSEEAGVEKPHPQMFHLGLQKLGLQAVEVAMVGDNYAKDIQGALDANIHACWLEQADSIAAEEVTVFNDFEELWNQLSAL